jgi:glycosyltransferase involved in cell wall biosynthesis
MTAAKPALLVLTSTYPRWAGDTEPAFVHELCRRLAPSFKLSVLAPHAPGAKLYESLDGVQVRRFRYLPDRWETLCYEGGIPAKLRREPWRAMQLPFFLVALFGAAFLEIRRRRPAILHAHWLIPQGVVAALFKVLLPDPPAVICTVHGADLYTQRGVVARALKTWALRRIDKLTLVSPSMLPLVLELGASKHRIEVASMGADLKTRFVPAGGAREDGRIVFAGRLVEKKGVHLLLEALALIAPRRPHLRLVIAGDGPERTPLQQCAGELGLTDRTEFIGAISQERMAALYQSAAMAVFPFVAAAGGDQEGFGLVVVEAQGCACPVIASDVPAVRDTIIDGETGLLVQSGNVADLATRIEFLLDNPELALRLGTNGRRSAVERFDWDAVAARYLRILPGTPASSSR